MKLSLVTVHTNDKLILDTIASVYKTVKTPFEYIIVDNNVNQVQFKNIREQYPQIKILQNPKNYGYARAMNVGLRHAAGDFVLALNPDVLLFENTIDEMVGCMEKHNDTVVLGPKLLNADGSLQYSCRRFPKFSILLLRRGLAKGKVTKQMKSYEMRDWDHESVKEVDWLCGGFLLVRRELFAKIGYMDEFYFLYFDDVDFCRRAHKEGKVVYFPTVHAIHSASYESKTKLVPFMIHIQSMLYYYFKFMFFPNKWLVKGYGWMSVSQMHLRERKNHNP